MDQNPRNLAPGRARSHTGHLTKLFEWATGGNGTNAYGEPDSGDLAELERAGMSEHPRAYEAIVAAIQRFGRSEGSD